MAQMRKKTSSQRKKETDRHAEKTASGTAVKTEGAGAGAGKDTAAKAAPKEEIPKKKILFVTAEASPFAHTGGLGEVAAALPKALNRKRSAHIDCRVIMPLYRQVSEVFRAKMEYLGSCEISVAWRRMYMGVFQLRYQGVTYYFIDNEYYFGRDAMYGHYDDCERFTFFSKAVFESMAFTGFSPDIIHANDWQTALVPVYQTALYKKEFVKTVFTVHNVEYQGSYNHVVMGDIIDIPQEYAHLVEMGDSVNLMKGGIEAANAFTTVSPSYAEELKDPANAFGLDEIVRRNAFKLRGILNGIDTGIYNPEKDTMLPANYTATDRQGKKACKTALQGTLGLPVCDAPLLVMISRLVAAKGTGLVVQTMDGILDNLGCQFVLLGTGDLVYEEFFRGLQARHPDKAVCMIEFNTEKSHRLYAAADMLLMPSRSEACGLAQMISCRYGTVPIVREVGGLKDSIKDCTLGDGSGFVFSDFSAATFYNVVAGAIARYGDRENWEKLVEHDMHLDFGWGHAANEYLDMYNSL
ncbi:MAG: glycogen/starch synthase [Eubacteriales bacterium]|nr:glycogen/starch synthase [Eubacteriales bacterium]